MKKTLSTQGTPWTFLSIFAICAGSAGTAWSAPLPAKTAPKAEAAIGVAPSFTAVNEALDIRASTVQTLDFSQRAESSLTTAVVVDGETWTLELEKHSVRSPDFEVWVQDPTGALMLADPPPVQTYRGTVLELPGSEVRASFHDGEIQAVVHTKEGLFGIQPLSKAGILARPGEHAVYRNSDWVNKRGYSCAAEAGQQVEKFDGQVEPQEDGPTTAGAGFLVAEIAVDADFEFFQINGSNVAATIQDMENVINGMGAIFESQLNITYEISSATVRTSEPDPYTTTNYSTLLSQLVGHWNAQPQSAVHRDLVHLFTGKDLDGSVIGIAYVGAVCNLSWAYGLSQSRFTSSMTSRVALTAHEIGHNWNAQHCNGCTACANCCQIMCSGIGGCSGILTSFGCQELTQISAFRDTRTCLSTATGCTTNADCDDGLYCNGAETCVGGSCQSGLPPNCADTVACTVDTCNETTNQCVHTATNSLCSDGLYCNGTETCNAATGCVAGTPPNCGDTVSCTVDSCNEATDQCVHTPNNTLCSDGLFCNGAETCNPTTGCVAGVSPCLDAIACTADACIESTDQCTHAPNNALCNDGLYCNGTETCNAAIGCLAGTAPNCNDNIACTADSCNETTDQCAHTPNNAVCSDGLFCNGAETCNPTTGCVTGSAPCEAGECDEGTDECVTGGDGQLWLVFTDAADIPGVGTVQNEDIVAYDSIAGTWSLVFDGSDVGLSSQTIDGMAVLPSGDILLSFTLAANISGMTGGPGGTLLDDSDIVRFVPTSLGAATAGSFVFYFDGSDVGLSTDAEDIDAISLTPEGKLVLSTTGFFSATGASGDDKDLIVFSATSLGASTTGSFAMYFDAGDVSLTFAAENVDGAGLTSSGTILLSTVWNFSVPGVSGADEDIVEFIPATLGATTSGTYLMFLDLSTLGIAADENVNALELVE